MSAENTKNKTKTSQLSKEQLIQAALKKRQCKTIANNVIAACLNPYVSPDDFVKMLKFINPAHYEDIVEERFILKLCGYPICENVLENIPTKKYHISTKLNKVYDITERKRFCSMQCFKGSEFIKSQIPTSALWLREKEEIPEMLLLTSANTLN